MLEMFSRIKLDKSLLGFVLFILILASFAISSIAAPPKPAMLKVSGYDVGSSAYITVAAAGGGMKKVGVTLRYIPAGTGIARLLNTRVKNTDFSALGPDAFFAAEGLYDFSGQQWGPQPIRMVWQAAKLSGYGISVRANSGIKTLGDLKGKKVPHVVASPSPNQFVRASLAFAGLSLKDVEVIEVHSFTAMYDALLAGTIDMCPNDSFTSAAAKLAASANGIHWLPMPPEDKEGWIRFLKIEPFNRPAPGIRGAGLSKDKPVPLANRAFPWFVAYDSLDENTAYWIAKAFDESYEYYKGAHSAMPGFKMETMLDLPGVFPWHEGCVKYFKEKGVWTAKHEKDQKALLARQKKLAETWEQVNQEATAQKIKAKEFPKFWAKKRSEAFPNYYISE
jgi:TRAP transporter TAXI family solute receptor